MSEQPLTIGARVRAARLEAGWTQAEAARRAGISQGTWSDLERGRQTEPKLSTLSRAAAAIGCPLADLLP